MTIATEVNTMSTSAETIHVAGAGIGGLATAAALQGQGLPVVVHDRAPELTPIGAGLSLWPNAVLALEALGVTGLRGGTIPRGGAGLYRWDGEPLAKNAGEAIEQRYGAPLVLLHRAELQQALLAVLAPGSLRLGEALESFTQDEGRVSLRFADGGTDSGALLVGADGLRSTVRAELLGDESPRESGLIAHRGVVALDAPPLAGELWGADGVFGVAPLSGGRVYWYATQREGDSRDLLEIFGDWAAPVPEILRRSTDVLRHRLYDRPPARRWAEGRVALLGDAAHPMLPFLGQGACQAIEDAVALGDAVRTHGAVPDALRAYEQARRRRAAMLVKRSRAAGRVAHVQSRWKRGLRDELVRRTPERARYRQLDAAIGAS
jgi:2-polyprenyl-6-methoxyphenol hydroxylase-like FAD-dependent oxidoreductase